MAKNKENDQTDSKLAKIFFTIWFSFIYMFISFTIIFFYDFIKGSPLFAILTFPFIILVFAVLLLFFTAGKFGIKKITKTEQEKVMNSGKDKWIYYYILPNLFFFSAIPTGVFDVNLLEGIIIAIVTILVRNLFDFWSDKLLDKIKNWKLPNTSN